MGNSARGHRLPALLMVLVAMVVAILVAIGVAPDTGTAQVATGSDATIEATSFTVGHLQTREEYAKCPAKKRALGGGVVQSGQHFFNLWVHASGPLDATGFTSETNDGDKARQWYAAEFNQSGEPRNFKVFAICSATSDATIEATPFSVAGNNTTGEAFAKCPARKRALGGGVVQSGSAGGLFVQASGPLDATGITAETNDGDRAKQWYAAVENRSGVPRDLKVFAICSATSDATIEATPLAVVGSELVPIATGEEYAKCPAKKRALGGGVVQSGSPIDLYVDASGPLDATGITAETNDGDKAKQWYAAVLNLSKAQRNFKVFAICE